jgi:hypothetical protein
MQGDHSGVVTETPPVSPGLIKRRRFLVGAGGLLAGGLWAKVLRDYDERAQRASVFIAKASSYSEELDRKIRQGLAELGLARSWVAG